MKRSALYSLFLHVFILGLFSISIGNPFHKMPKPEQAMIFDFVQVDDVSAAPVLTPEQRSLSEPQESKKSSKSKSEKKPAPKHDTKPDPKPEPQPESKPDFAPPPAPTPPPPPVLMPEPTPIPLPAPEPTPQLPEPPQAPKPEVRQPNVPKPEKREPEKRREETLDLTLEKKKAEEQAAKQAKKEKKKIDEDFSQLMDDLTKKEVSQKEKAKVDDDFSKLMEDISSDDSSSKGSSSHSKNAAKRGEGAPADRLGPVLTGSDVDAIRRHMRKCWIVPAGVLGVKDTSVPIELQIDENAVVTKAQIMERDRLRDPAYRAIAESAHRAVMSPHCNPMPIPPEKRERYKKMIFDFNPKNM